jgi:hypothetical protein
MASILMLDKPPYAVPQWGRGFEIRTQLLNDDGLPVALPAGAGAAAVRFTLAWTDVVPRVMVRGRDNVGTGHVVDAARGIVGYTVQPGDFSRTGGYRAEFWVEGASQRFAFPVRSKLDLRVYKTLDRL